MQNIKYRTRIIVIFVVVILMTIFLGMEFLTVQNYEELPEVKLKNKEDENKFAIMVQNENKDGYQEYDGNEFPTDDYEFNETETKCIDNNGALVEEALTYIDGKVTLETDKTIYCTLYFDKKEPLKITNVAVDNSIARQAKLTVSVTGGDGNYTYSVENSCLNEYQSVKTDCGFNGNQVNITYNANIITLSNLNCCYKHIFTIKVTDKNNNIDIYTVKDISITGCDSVVCPGTVAPYE